jgi:FkbM family methyltransferase
MTFLFLKEPSARSSDFEVVEGCLTPGDTCVDVGANVGTLTLAAALRVGPTGKIIAFEPHPKIGRFLAENVALNRLENVQIQAFAVGSSAESVSFSNDQNDDLNHIGSETAGIQIGQVTLDSVLPERLPVALLKIDVEGYELEVLKGAEKTLSRTSSVYIEVSRDNLSRYGAATQDVINILIRHRFQVFHLSEDGFWEAVGPGYLPLKADDNVLAVRDTGIFKRNQWRIIPAASLSGAAISD